MRNFWLWIPGEPVPSLESIVSLFETKAEAKRWRKDALELANNHDWHKADENIIGRAIMEAEFIHHLFQWNRPAAPEVRDNDDFIAEWAERWNGGTAKRRKAARYVKEMKRAKKKSVPKV